MAELYRGNVEPSIDELLYDEIAGLLRKRDGLCVADVLRVVECAREKMSQNNYSAYFRRRGEIGTRHDFHADGDETAHDAVVMAFAAYARRG